MTSRDETPTSAATLRRALLTMERMQRQLDEAQQARTEPIAVVGLGCRFPGGVVDAETYWEVLRTGTDAVREIPADRWDVNAFYDEQPQQPGKMSTRWGGFLDRVDQFDHDFFGISRREALAMDPQQRLTLEVAWEALENAGQAPSARAGSRTGVFMGVCSNDFATEFFPGAQDVTAYVSTGTAHSVVTGRLSYVLDLRGPSVAVDSACSSSLVAVQMACQSLRLGECDMALAGGVNVVLSPLPSVAFSQFPGMVSPDGRCRTFDASSNGYVRSEGCGVVVLRRLSDAVRDGDRVLAVIRGGAVNQDGRSSGVTAPSGQAQRDVLRRALAASGVRPEEVGYVEAHGTGTRLGDPIEVEALAEVYGRPDGHPLYLGSGKTNIGHLEAAAGIAGLIKTVLCLDRGLIPPNVHFERLNPHISFEGTTFAVPTELTPWPTPAGTRVAGVSSFGFSGTNAHLILAEAPARQPAPADERRPLSVLTISAKTGRSLAESADRYARQLTADADTPVADVCHSANTGRSHFRHRLAVVGGSGAELAERLTDYVDGLPGDGVRVGEAGNADVVFVFTGQGPQRVGMARQLYQTQPTFRALIDRCDEILRPLLETPLLSVIYPPDERSELVYETAYSQPALFAVEYALAQLWRSWGVEPVAVLGHSFGEYVAACVAGAMSLEDGLALIVERGRLMQSLAKTGSMATVFAPEEAVAEAIADHQQHVSIAAVNGPANTSISGDREVVAAICERFTAQGVQTKLLRITTASHSPLVDPILEPLRRAAEQVNWSPPRIPLLSNLTGQLWPWDTAPDADYWCRHARQPVRFAENLATVYDLGYRVFLEAGPAPTLLGLIGDVPPAADGAGQLLLLPSLRPKQDDWPVLLDSLAQLYTRGADIDWAGFDAGYQRTRVPVPTYPFERTVCWAAPRRRSDGGPATIPAGADQDGESGDEGYADDDLLYRLAWRPAPEETPAESTAASADQENATWLVLADAGTSDADADARADADADAARVATAGVSVGDRLAEILAARGGRTVRVRPGAAYRHEGDEATVRLDDPGDLIRLIDEVSPTGDATLHVVHLWALDGREETVGTTEDVLAGQRTGLLSAIRTAQALSRSRAAQELGGGAAGGARLWLVTRGAVTVAESGDAPHNVGQATLWGLGRSLQQEQTSLWGGLIDLDPRDGAQAAATALLDAIERRGAEDQAAFRAGRRHVARLVRAEPPEPAAAPWRTDASYLITGGLGGVGLAVARSLVRAGARRLVLVGRTPIPPRAQWAGLAADDPVGRRVAAVRELESLGASVHLESLDVSDFEAVRDFLLRYDQEGWPAIRGVVHAAGTGDVAPLNELTPADLERHLRPKAVGAWVLHRLFADRPLDFFVLFSSTSSVLSSPFVASYAAANAYLDALANARRAAGLPALSVNWGIWADTGLAARGADATPGLSKGMGTLTPDQALRAFHRLLGQREEAQLAVVPVDWAQWGRRYQEVSGSPLLTDLVAEGGAPAATRRRSRASRLPSRAELLELPADERRALLTERLLAGVAATLGAPANSIGADQSLFDLGLDSLMAVELRNEVERQLVVSLPISVLMAGATVHTLADQVLERLAADGGGETAAPAPTIQRVQRVEDVASDLLAQLDALSDEQARAAVAGEGRSGE